ncbi:type II toxin-antitoxin system HicB family antitoxin [bacterium]|nr:MAG: type II toxin-antitoxin system HicB family antitoxin [bacterium]
MKFHFELQPGGGYTASIPSLPGCVSQGETIKEARKNILDALRGYLAVSKKRSLQGF